MIIAVAKETFPASGAWRSCRRRSPRSRSWAARSAWKPALESAAGFTDDAYRAAGAEIVADRRQLFEAADVVLQVRALGANPDGGRGRPRAHARWAGGHRHRAIRWAIRRR